MTRCTNWPTVLAAKVEEWRRRPLVYGSTDCFQFAADVVLALTGRDYRQEFPQYASRDEAAEILAEYGDAIALISSLFGLPKPVAFAGRGDLVVAEMADSLGLGAAICIGVNCCTPGPRGLVFQPTIRSVAAWTV